MHKNGIKNSINVVEKRYLRAYNKIVFEFSVNVSGDDVTKVSNPAHAAFMRIIK